MRTLTLAYMVAAVAIVTVALAGEERYLEFLEKPTLVNSVRSLGVLFLSLPHDHDVAITQIERNAWYNSKVAELDDAAKAGAQATMRGKLGLIETLVKKHKIDKLGVAGFSYVGNKEHLDIYFDASTPNGPVMIRTSIQSFNGETRIFDLNVYEGWEDCRQATAQIEHRAGDKKASVNYTPKPKQTDEAERG